MPVVGGEMLIGRRVVRASHTGPVTSSDEGRIMAMHFGPNEATALVLWGGGPSVGLALGYIDIEQLLLLAID